MKENDWKDRVYIDGDSNDEYGIQFVVDDEPLDAQGVKDFITKTQQEARREVAEEILLDSGSEIWLHADDAEYIQNKYLKSEKEDK